MRCIQCGTQVCHWDCILKKYRPLFSRHVVLLLPKSPLPAHARKRAYIAIAFLKSLFSTHKCCAPRMCWPCKLPLEEAKRAPKAAKAISAGRSAFSLEHRAHT
ncbi:MAG: hypothetical protein ACK55Z_08745, partial [bacterium]